MGAPGWVTGIQIRQSQSCIGRREGSAPPAHNVLGILQVLALLEVQQKQKSDLP